MPVGIQDLAARAGRERKKDKREEREIKKNVDGMSKLLNEQKKEETR